MKRYNISKKSDLKRFERDINAKVKDIAKQKALSMPYTVKCENCGNDISVHAGSNVCPFCRKAVNLKVNVTWK